jgi:hypothetical protein
MIAMVTCVCVWHCALHRFFRDFTPGLPCALMQDGSDCCEKVFSELCGSGASSTMQRIYTHHDALRAVPKYWHVEEQMCNPDAPLKKRSHEKLCDVWHKVSKSATLTDGVISCVLPWLIRTITL